MTIYLQQNTKNSLQKQEKNFILVPTQLFSDKNTTYREKTLLLAHYLHSKQNHEKLTITKLSSLSLRYTNFKTDKPTRKLKKALSILQNKGYISYSNNNYSILNAFKYKISGYVALDSELFHRKDIDYMHLCILGWLSLRKETETNCNLFIAKELQIDRNTASKYLKLLEDKKIVKRDSIFVNEKTTPNFHLKQEYKAAFFKRSQVVNKYEDRAVNGDVPFSAQIDYYFKKIINRLDYASNLSKMRKKVFTLSDVIDSKSFEVKRMMNCIKTNLYFKNKLVTLDEINEKLIEIYEDLNTQGVIKVFNNPQHFINFASSLFKTASYPLEKGINDHLLLKDIQSTVFDKKKEKYSIEFIKWLATKLFRKDFVIYHVNVFKNRLIEALMDEKRTGEETERWSEESYIDWDEIHRQDKLKYINQNGRF